MNQKASNKYLFDQVVSCYNCKYYKSLLGKYTECRKHKYDTVIYTYYSIVTARMLEDLCGPLGKDYISKDDKSDDEFDWYTLFGMILACCVLYGLSIIFK